MNTKIFDVIVVGELNVDLILNSIDSFPEMGKEKIAKNMTLTLGSSSAIFASNLSALGPKTAFIGKIGNDSFGKVVIDSLKQKGVNTDFIIKSDEWNTGATIVLNYDQDRAMVTYPGAMEHLVISDISEKVLSQARHLHFSSYFLQPGIQPDLKKLFQCAKNLGLTTSLDIQWDPSEKWEFNYKEILPLVDVFLPNEQEIVFLTKESSVDNAINKLMPFAKHLVIKMGSKGSLLVSEDKKIFKESFLNNDVVDSIGAGDSFNAGFIFQFISGAELSECQVFGNLTGAINTTAAGGTAAFNDYENIITIGKQRFGFNS